jgi:hypothetical protein
MSIIFEVTAYDGRTLRLSEAQWRHTLFFHPEVESEQMKIKEVVQKPEVVLEGATKDTRVCYRFYPSTPVTSKHLAVVIKVLDREGFIITSYFTERMRKGVVLWRGIK